MIDVDATQERIRGANPVPDLEQLDSDEITRFVALAEPSLTSDLVDAEPMHRQAGRRRGPLVAIASAAVGLSAVALTIVIAGSIGGGGSSGEEPEPVATGEIATTLRVNSALYTKRLVPHPAENPPPLSTAIGDLEFEMLEFESPAYNLWHVDWTKHGLVSIANDRLYWSTDYYDWESIGPVDGDGITVVDDDVIVHGGHGPAVRYEWQGDVWAELSRVDVDDAQGFAFGANGAVAVGSRVGEDVILYSTDGVHFVEAEQAPDLGWLADTRRGWCPELFGPPGGLHLLATGNGYVALLASYSSWNEQQRTCEPLVWFSSDGNEWALLSEESPFGDSAAVNRVVAWDGRFVATGGVYLAPAVVWVSDDGLAWDRIDLDLQMIDAIAVGEMGWVVTGWRHDQQLIMFSADGITWDGPYERPETLGTGYLPPQIAVGDDVIFGIGGGHMDALIARLRE